MLTLNIPTVWAERKPDKRLDVLLENALAMRESLDKIEQMKRTEIELQTGRLFPHTFQCPECSRIYTLDEIGVKRTNQEITLSCECGAHLEVSADPCLGWHKPRIEKRVFER